MRIWQQNWQASLVKVGHAKAQFIEEDCSQADARALCNKGHPCIDCPYCKHSFSPNADIHTRQQLLDYLIEDGEKEAKESKDDPNRAGTEDKSEINPNDSNSEKAHAPGPQFEGEGAIDHGEACAVAEDTKPGKDQRKKKKTQLRKSLCQCKRSSRSRSRR